MSDKNPSETVEGGRYQVNGEWVDANGKPVDAPEEKRKPAKESGNQSSNT